MDETFDKRWKYLADVMHGRDALLHSLKQLIAGVKALGLPVLWLEQNPDRMGATVPELAELLPGQRPITKMSFSCCGAPPFVAALAQSARRQVILCGIETHVCICQTARDLGAAGYAVEVVEDAVSSRTPDNKRLGLDKVRAAGGQITSVETILFELLRTAEHPAFRTVLRLVK